jgi:hypothetical protein
VTRAAAGEVRPHTRGADGYLVPYAAAEVRAMVEAAAQRVAGRRAWRRALVQDHDLALYRLPEAPCGLGPVLAWVMRTNAGQAIAAGHFERDIEWERETGRRGWVAQSAYVLAEYQRHGIYTGVLRSVSAITRWPLLPDTQQTRACAGVWARLVPDPERQGLRPT